MSGVQAAGPVPLWAPTHVTLLGDAIDAMSPARGSGASIALLDAGNLCRGLVQAADGELPLRDAIHAYEEEMAEYGFGAVRDSVAVLREGGGMPERLASALYWLRRDGRWQSFVMSGRRAGRMWHLGGRGRGKGPARRAADRGRWCT
jgi:hypothetical protein